MFSTSPPFPVSTAVNTLSPAGFGVRIFSCETEWSCECMFSPLPLIHLSFHGSPFKPLLCVFSFCFSVTFQTAASSLLSFHLSALPTVAFSVCVPRRERKKKKKIQNPTNVEKFLTEFSAPLPDGRLEMKSCRNGDGILFAYLFIYRTEVLVNKCVSFEGKTFNERGFQWVQPHPERTLFLYCFPLDGVCGGKLNWTVSQFDKQDTLMLFWATRCLFI